ncbi:MAG: DNA translocase FtsK 4TM domain-containing protein [Oligoflexia bacterium]|nr:DNA translocase FtsK 4TM domain-containing protein [Oligoflexia bacterium]
MAPLLEKFRRDIVGTLWAALGLFLALALLSFNPADPSFNSALKVSQNYKAGLAVHNLCGYFGSFLSDIFYQVLGISSWLIIVGTLRRSAHAFQGKPMPAGKLRMLWGVLLLLVFASLFGLYLPETRIFQNHVSLGGAVGVIVSQGLVNIFNRAGVGIILWTSAVVLVIFYTEKRLTEILPRNMFNPFSILVAWKAKFKISALKLFKRKEKPALVITQSGMRDGLIHNNPVKFSLDSQASGADDSEETGSFASVIRNPMAAKKEKIANKLKAVFNQAPRLVENWELPNLNLLNDPPGGQKKIDEREISRNARLVEQKLAEFDVLGQVVEVKPGPAVTMYEFRPAASIKINDITKLTDDLSLALSAESLRIIAPIPGRDVVGIETSNSKRDTIYMKELLESRDFWSEDIKLPVALGKNVSGEPKIIDLRKIPHLLVAGTTGSGKSVFIMSLVTSLIMRHSPKTLRLIIVDPKQVDLAVFHQIPHLLMPPVKDAKPAVNTLKWLIREMEKRYRSMSRFNSKSIEAYNDAVTAIKSDELETHRERIKAFEDNPQTAMQSYYCEQQPYIVAVIEEFADLMSVDRSGVEPAVVRLAQMARASGIHLVIAMQSPRREVLTGLIKTNFPGRISFKVASKVDSSIVLDQRGAERLLSVGDMLYLAPGLSQPQRYHGAFLRDEEMTAVSEFWMKQGTPQFNSTAVLSMEEAENAGSDDEYMNPDREEGYDEVVAFVTSQREVSASLIQRRFRFGYPKAARLIEILENEGVVGPSNGSKPRSVLANKIS